LQNAFFQNIKQISGWQQAKYLIALSGGLDSVVLTHLFKHTGLTCETAHCNFKLRGKESDEDQKFVKQFAKDLNIPLHIKVCDLSHTTQNTQLAAREERYKWFKQLITTQDFDYLVTAHHLDDSIETFFINLQRGSGLKGLLGIQNKQNILRPLLPFTRKEIHAYALKHHLSWREDSSNASDKYVRNYIRHHIIPEFKKSNPQFYKNFSKTLNFLKQSQMAINEWVQEKMTELVITDQNTSKLDLNKFQKISSKELFLFEWLSPYGFTDQKAINQLITSQTGKEIFSQTHRLTKHGNYLHLQSIQPKNDKVYQITAQQNEIFEPLHLKITLLDRKDLSGKQIKSAGKHEVYIDFDKLQFPLKLRRWKAGDYFYPLGMQGKKKLSDYLTDMKIPLPEKEKIYLLCNQNDIIWVVDKRLDDRYKITNQTRKILHIKQLD